MARQTNKKGLKRTHTDHRRVQARTQQMMAMNRFALFLFVLVGSAAVFVTVLPQKRKLADMEHELAAVQQKELEARQYKDLQHRKYRAIEEGAGYKETEARDRLDLYKPGETIFRFPETVEE